MICQTGFVSFNWSSKLGRPSFLFLRRGTLVVRQQSFGASFHLVRERRANLMSRLRVTTLTVCTVVPALRHDTMHQAIGHHLLSGLRNCLACHTEGLGWCSLQSSNENLPVPHTHTICFIAFERRAKFHRQRQSGC